MAIDLYCGLGGWTDGLLEAGYRVVGFDNQRHEYGEHRYPAQLVIQDVLTLHGSQFKDAALIVASPPCTEYSYMAMPWTRAKKLGEWYAASPERQLELNALFNACFRLQREATEAAGQFIPLVVENVKGAQRWVGRSRWNFGSFHLWGDVPALMPPAKAIKNAGGSWFNVAHNTTSGKGRNPDGRLEGIKQGGTWFHDSKGTLRSHSSKSKKRKEASAMIAKIPLELARHIGSVYLHAPSGS